MGQSLARVGNVPPARDQRASLIAFLEGVDRLLERLNTTFAADTQAVPEGERRPVNRIAARVATLRANVADELAQLNDSAQAGSEWLSERIENTRTIVGLTDELSSDMIGLLETGTVPSEKRQRNQVLLFGGVAAAIAGVGTYLWWRNEKAAETEQERMLASGEIEDCGCTE